MSTLELNVFQNWICKSILTRMTNLDLWISREVIYMLCVCVCVFSELVCVKLVQDPCSARVWSSSVPFTVCLGFSLSRSCSSAVLLCVSTDSGITTSAHNQRVFDHTHIYSSDSTNAALHFSKTLSQKNQIHGKKHVKYFHFDCFELLLEAKHCPVNVYLVLYTIHCSTATLQ